MEINELKMDIPVVKMVLGQYEGGIEEKFFIRNGFHLLNKTPASGLKNHFDRLLRMLFFMPYNLELLMI